MLHWTLSGGVTDANDVFLSMLGYSSDDLSAGRIDWFALTPEEWRAADADGMVQVRASGKHEPFRKEFFRRDGTRVPVLLGSALYPDSQSEGVSFVLDISRLESEEERELEGAIQRRIAGVLEGIGDAFLMLDSAWRIAYMNAEAERLAGRHRNEVIGRSHGDGWPASGVGTELERQLRRVAQGRAPAHFETLYDGGTARAWFEVRAYPAEGGGINVFYRDVSDRKRAEVTLRTSEERLRDVQARMESALLAGDIGTWTWDMAREGVRGDATTARLLSLDPDILAAGRVSVERFFDVVHEEDRARAERSVADALAGRQEYRVEYRVVFPDGSCRWIDARGKVLLDTATGTPVFMSGVVVDITERVEREREREKLLAEVSARAEREALVNQIGEGIRQSLPPERIEEIAVVALGGALAADRCYLMSIDLARDAITIVRDWCAEGVPSMVGHYRVSDLGVDFGSLFASGTTLVVPDARPESERRLSEKNAQTNERVGVSSFLNVPFFEGERVVGALGVAMAGGARDWTAEEITLTETVAGQLRSVLETARLQQRERNIAEQLQEVLTPPAPPQLPGLSLASYYRPALAEAGVGGDFFDVFPVAADCTALVVADLSGKGLAAAQQVATVRNMLRFALYNGHSVSEAIARLHISLVEHDLLTGFATLFVGLYDHGERTMTYVNCGQEPGLIWREVTGALEQLRPTGPVLGGFGEGAFEQATVPLFDGDVLAIFTDGLTEVGPSRKQLLEVEGVGALLRSCCTDIADATNAADSRAVVDRLIAEVDAFSRGGRRDDIALLVGVVGDSGDGGNRSERRPG